MASILAVADIQLDAPGALQPWEIKDGWRANAWPMRQVSLAVGGVSDWFDPLSYDLPEDIPLPLVTDLSPRRFAVTTAGDSVLVEVLDYDADVEGRGHGHPRPDARRDGSHEDGTQPRRAARWRGGSGVRRGG